MTLRRSIFPVAMAVAALLAFTPADALARGPGGPEGSGSGQGYHRKGPHGTGQVRWMEELNLTDAQKEKIDAIRKEHRTAMQSKSSRLRSEQQKLRVMMKSDLPEEEVNAQFNKVQELRTQFARSRFNAALKIRQVLSAEQREKMDELKENRRKVWRERKGIRKDPPPEGPEEDEEE